MKLNLNVLLNNSEIIKKLGCFDFGSPVINYKFAKTMKKIEEESKLYVSEQIKLFEKYGKKLDDGSYSLKKEKITVLNNKLEELGTVEIEIDWEKTDVPLDCLKGFTANEMNFIENYFINIVEEVENNGN